MTLSLYIIEEGFIQKTRQYVVVAFWGKIATHMLLLRRTFRLKIPNAAYDLAPRTELTTVCLAFCINPSSMLYIDLFAFLLIHTYSTPVIFFKKHFTYSILLHNVHYALYAV